MNEFKENLKYNPNNLSKETGNSNTNSLSHKIKKAAMIGGLSIMAAISSVGCSKSEDTKDNGIMALEVSENSSKTEFSKNEQAKQSLLEDTQNLVETLQNYADSSLSESDALKLENLLLKYIFIETSNNYNGDIPYQSIIPNRNQSLLSGSFYINHEDKKNIKNYNEYEDNGLVLDTESTELYNDYYSNILEKQPVKNALSALYNVELSLCKENKELLKDLSYEELVNLMKSSYVSAYNNKLATNSDYTSDQAVNASDFIVYVNQETDGQYSLSSYRLDDNGNHSLFETTLDANHVEVIDDYLEAYSTFYEDSSNVEAILSDLKTANKEHQVSEYQLVEQLTDISLHPEKMDAYLTKTGLKWSARNVSDDGR